MPCQNKRVTYSLECVSVLHLLNHSVSPLGAVTVPQPASNTPIYTTWVHTLTGNMLAFRWGVLAPYLGSSPFFTTECRSQPMAVIVRDELCHLSLLNIWLICCHTSFSHMIVPWAFCFSECQREFAYSVLSLFKYMFRSTPPFSSLELHCHNTSGHSSRLVPV